jgi:hypothetical protein
VHTVVIVIQRSTLWKYSLLDLRKPSSWPGATQLRNKEHCDALANHNIEGAFIHATDGICDLETDNVEGSYHSILAEVAASGRSGLFSGTPSRPFD